MSTKQDVIIDEVRRILKKYTPDTERFTSVDVAKFIPDRKRHKLSCALRQLENFGEIVKVDKVTGTSGGKRHLLNVYVTSSTAIRLKVVNETHIRDPWFTVWPEMYEVPAMIKYATSQTKRVHTQR